MFSVDLCCSMIREMANKHLNFDYIFLKSNFINEFILFDKMEMHLLPVQ